MQKCHIYLTASMFHCFKLITKLWEDKFPYCKVTKIIDYFKLQLQACIISPTVIVKICSISCLAFSIGVISNITVLTFCYFLLQKFYSP